MITNWGSTKNVFRTPGARVLMLGCGLISHIVKMHFFINFLFTPRHRSDKLNIVMMTKEGFTKIVNFMTPGAGVLVLERGHISHIVKLHCFFNNLLLYSQA